MGFAQGEYVFQSVFANRFEKREANSGPLVRRLPIPVEGSRSALPGTSPLYNILTRIGQ